MSGKLNSAGTRGANEERIDELRLSLSRAPREFMGELREELPFNRRGGTADLGFEPWGGDPELMVEVEDGRNK